MSTLELTALIGIILGGLSLANFALAHLGMVSPVYMAASLVAALLCACIILRRYIRLRSCPELATELPPVQGGRLSALEWGLLIAICFFVVLIRPFDLAPPIARSEMIEGGKI